MEDLELAVVKIEGDMKFHVFVHHGLVFMSTSPRFSRDLIQIKTPIQIPSGDGRLVHVGQIKGETIGNLYGSIFQWWHRE